MTNEEVVSSIAVLKVEIEQVKADLKDAADQRKEIKKSLEELLVLKNKGAGIFWLASALFGVVIATGIKVLGGWLIPHG
jgi:uncharacterized protein Smg (DUF494 family)